jgi:hypothetical protein
MLRFFYAKCHLCQMSIMLVVSNKPIILNVVTLNVVMLSVAMLKVVLLCVAITPIMISANMLIVIMLSVVRQNAVASKITLWYISTTTFIIMPFGIPILSIEIRNGHSE